jgi:hypothetical protein|tara:strand:+ start:199 stop:462 length:264 start_codon:yes stop_codon:yes gene_type:complete
MTQTITVTISDADVKVLENDLLDIDSWVQDAVTGKINNCRKRMVVEWQPKVMADPDVATMPADEQVFIDSVLSRSDYKNRAARDATI